MTKTCLTVPVYAYIFLLLTFLTSPSALATKAPVFELPGNSGPVSLKEYRNQVVFIDFWASWCVPCRYSFPWMNQMQERYGDQGLKVIGINVDKDKALAQKFLEHIPASFDIAYDPEGEVADLYKLKVMPSSYLIDRDGNLVHAHKGFKTSDGIQMEDRIRKLLNDKK